MQIIIAGDYCPRHRVQEKIDQGAYDYVLGEVKDVVSQSDYSIVNFECPVTDDNAKPKTKWGPNLGTNRKGLDSIKWAGFDCVTLANNHFDDYGADGVQTTIQVSREIGLDYVGGGNNLLEASATLYKEINGEKLAIINCCENEFSIAGATVGGSAPLDPIKQYYAIKEAKLKADYVLVIVHGGHEFFQLPSPRMVETYRFFIDAGADAVVNHHQHCYSGYEVYHEKPIFYGLGNFCFDRMPARVNDTWNYGYIASLTLCKGEVSFKIIPYEQCSNDSKVKLLPENTFDESLIELNKIICSSEMLRERVEAFYRASSFYWGHAILEPLNNKYYLAAVKRHLVPSLISEKRKLRAENYICCEAHRDKLMYCLKNNI